jgi:hypothetical protein
MGIVESTEPCFAPQESSPYRDYSFCPATRALLPSTLRIAWNSLVRLLML